MNNGQTEETILLPETFTELKPDYLRDGLLPPDRLFRRDGIGKRFYLRPVDETGTAYRIAIGLTSAIPHFIAINNDWLTKWKIDVGLDASSQIADRAAAFGTMGHALIGEYCKLGYFDFSIVADYVRENIPPRYLETDLKQFQDRMRKSMCSVAQFFSDNDVVPHFVEYPVMIDEWGMAHYLDFKGEMTFNRKRVQFNLDWKFTKQATFGEAYEAQAAIARRLWNKYCDLKGIKEHTDMTFLFAPKDYTKANVPTYNLENCTKSSYDDAFDAYLNIWKSKKDEVLNDLPTSEIYGHGIFRIANGEKFEAEKHYSIINYEFLI